MKRHLPLSLHSSLNRSLISFSSSSVRTNSSGSAIGSSSMTLDLHHASTLKPEHSRAFTKMSLMFLGPWLHTEVVMIVLSSFFEIFGRCHATGGYSWRRNSVSLWCQFHKSETTLIVRAPTAIQMLISQPICFYFKDRMNNNLNRRSRMNGSFTAYFCQRQNESWPRRRCGCSATISDETC
jgi:hypothetical protein